MSKESVPARLLHIGKSGSTDSRTSSTSRGFADVDKECESDGERRQHRSIFAERLELLITIHKDRASQRTIKMENGSSEAKDPSSFLTEIIGAPVTVKLNSGIVYKGSSESKIMYIIVIWTDRGNRRASISGWVHEHRAGADEGVRQWKAAQELRRCLRQRKQWCVSGCLGKTAQTNLLSDVHLGRSVMSSVAAIVLDMAAKILCVLAFHQHGMARRSWMMV